MGGKVSSLPSLPSLSLKLFVHEAERKVVLAEANRDFVDVLLSSLITPLGAAVNLAGLNTGLGCMDRLYKSVADLDEKTFITNECKRMLLFPTSANRADCYDLVEHIDATSFRYHLCPSWERDRYWSSLYGVACPICGQKMGTMWTSPLYVDGYNPSVEGVFLKRNSKYLITDDLKVSLFDSVTVAAGEMRKSGVHDFNLLKEMKVEFGREELLTLFNNALSSKTPLSETFMEGTRNKFYENFKSSLIKQPSEVESSSKKMTIDLVISKTTGKLLYAEAKEDVVNLFFSFLTFPLGLICNLYNGNSSLGCIDNLWSSAKILTEQDQLRTDEHSNMLVRPKLAPYHSFGQQILKVEEGQSIITRSSKILHALNPKSPFPTIDNGDGFVKGATFMITDDLNIRMSSISEGLSIIGNNEMEAITINFGEQDALKLLKASLTSTTPLTTAFRELLPSIYQSRRSFQEGLFLNQRFLRRSHTKKLEYGKEL